MTVQIRENVFETNSSSSHSVVVSGEVATEFGLSKEEIREGVIYVGHCKTEFGWESEHSSDTHSKLAYLLIQAAGSYTDSITEDYNAKTKAVFETVRFVTGCELKLPASTSDWHIDHQSMGDCDDILEDPDQIAVFAFSPSSYVHTGNDNG